MFVSCSENVTKGRVYKKIRLKWQKSQENRKTQFPKLSVVPGQKSILHHHYIQAVKEGIQIRVYTINIESVIHYSQFISIKAKNYHENLRHNFGKS